VTSAFMEATLIVGVVNIGLTGVLVFLYRRVYKQTQATFTLALILFAGAFLLQNILVVYSDLATMPLIPDPLAPYLFGIGATEAVGLTAIAYTAVH
jgi:hypothetical protein